MVGISSLYNSFKFFLFEHFNNKTLKKIVLLSCMGNTVDGRRERSSRKFLNLEKEMQMLMGPGTRSSLQFLFPRELPSLHLPQGLGVPSSSIHLPLLHSGLCPEGL